MTPAELVLLTNVHAPRTPTVPKHEQGTVADLAELAEMARR